MRKYLIFAQARGSGHIGKRESQFQQVSGRLEERFPSLLHSLLYSLLISLL